MPQVTEAIIIPKPQEHVLSLLADVTRYPEWLTIHVDFPDGPPEDLGPGSTFRQKVKIMGMPGEVTWTVHQFDDERIDMSGSGPMGITLRSTFHVTGEREGSRVTMISDFSGGALKGRMGDTVAKQAQTSARKSLENLSAIA